MADLEDQILRALEGRLSPTAAVTRMELTSITGQTDRANRAAISALQTRGLPIVSLTKGYFMAANGEYRRRYLAREWKRIKTLAEKLRGIEPRVTEAIRQLELELGI